MASVARIRRCKTCKNVFIDPESLRKHKVYGDCRSHEALRAAGFVETGKGWKKVMVVNT